MHLVTRVPSQHQMVFLGDFPKEGHFNTFRHGRKWADKLHIGGNVDLVYAGLEAFGIAEVVGLHLLRFSDALEAYTLHNHMFDKRLNIAANEKRLVDSLAACYGADAVQGSEVYTVVQMKWIET